MSSCSRRMAWGFTSLPSQRSMASSSAASSAESVMSVVRFGFEVARALHHQDGALEVAYLHAGLVQADGLHADDAGVGTALRFALVEHLGLRVQGIAGEQGVGQPDVGPAEV